jgi:uncharacterized YccA/Bax inhibitor family protein
VRTSSNPALTRSEAFAGSPRTVGFNDRPQTQAPDWATGGPAADPLEQAYYSPSAGSLQTGRMTVEDVIVRTAILLGTAIAAGGFTWYAGLEFLAFPAAIIGLVLGLVIGFKQITNPVAIISYAALQGVFLGGISKLFEESYPGIVVQAVAGTAGTALTMLALYKSGRIRVTPQFQKMVIMATGGFLVLILANFVFSMFTGSGGIREGGIGLVVGIVAIGLASLNLVLDFDLIEKGAANGLPERYGWFAAFGLVVTLVWLYIEILRLLAILRGDD